MARPRLRSALLAAAVLTTTVPVVALATAPHLRCGVPLRGSWETIPVQGFKPVQGLSSPDSVTAYSVDEQTGKDVIVTNGVRVQLSLDHGCNWSDGVALHPAPSARQPFAGVGARIVSVALLRGTRVAAVSTGGRTHVLRQTPGGDWVPSDSGLPAAGTPKLLRAANDGQTLYLTLSPTTSGSGDGGTTGLPGLPLPGSGGVAAQTGLLYASTDRGRSWTLRTTATDLPTGGTGFTALDVDPANSNRVYGLIGGRFAVSGDGGASFTVSETSDYTALTAMGPSTVAAFRSGGQVAYSGTAGLNRTSYPAPAGVTSAAFRGSDASLLLEIDGRFTRFSVFDNLRTPVAAPSAARSGSLLGDRSEQSSFHAVSGHSLLRYVDPVPPGTAIPPIAIGDTSVPPPLPGTVVPAVRNVRLKVGEASTETFTLNLPKNPTPLDLVFLVDASGSQLEYIETLKTRIKDIVRALTATHLDLKVGVATMGAGPAEGERAYPLVYAYPPDTSDPLHPGKTRKYNRPVIYHLIRAVGDTGASLQKAVDAIEIESDSLPPGVGPDDAREGALLALQQVVKGEGIPTETEYKAGFRNRRSAVPPGQDVKFRANSSVRRVVILSTDEPFDTPYPQKKTPSGRPDFTEALRDLKAARTQVIGLSGGKVDALDDLRHVAQGSGTFAPPGGVVCDNGNESGVVEALKPGDPLVCNTADHFAEAIIRLLSSLVDRQNITLVPLAKTPVLGALQGRALLGLNVKQANSATFSVNVSCIDVKPGTYPASVGAVLRGTKVGTARLNVTCLKANAIVPPKPLPPVVQPPPPAPNPPAPAVPPLAPPAPAVQPQVQVQVQPQVQPNPMSAGALQEQQELQLALALNGTLREDDPVFNPGTQLAMVDRRKREHVQALYLLAFAMTTCSGLGLARLRSRPDPAVRRAT